MGAMEICAMERNVRQRTDYQEETNPVVEFVLGRLALAQKKQAPVNSCTRHGWPRDEIMLCICGEVERSGGCTGQCARDNPEAREHNEGMIRNRDCDAANRNHEPRRARPPPSLSPATGALAIGSAAADAGERLEVVCYSLLRYEYNRCSRV